MGGSFGILECNFLRNCNESNNRVFVRINFEFNFFYIRWDEIFFGKIVFFKIFVIIDIFVSYKYSERKLKFSFIR